MDALQYARQIAYSSEEVLQFSHDMAKKYCNDDGSVFVETGVAAGAQVIAMRAGCPTKRIYAFDSFKGICLPSNRDDQMPGIRFLSKEEQALLPEPGQQVLESSGATVVSELDFWNNIATAFGKQLKYHDHYGTVIYEVEGMNIVPIVGWFEYTVIDASRWIEPISLLRLDGDLYNSTYVCLKYLYPKVIKEGCIIIDDFALHGCREAVMDFWGENNILPKYSSIKDENSHVIYWTK